LRKDRVKATKITLCNDVTLGDLAQQAEIFTSRGEVAYSFGGGTVKKSRIPRRFHEEKILELRDAKGAFVANLSQWTIGRG